MGLYDIWSNMGTYLMFHDMSQQTKLNQFEHHKNINANTYELLQVGHG